MPRPRPPAPLSPRSIRMSDSMWGMFQMAGGPDWLRLKLLQAKVGAKYRRTRNNTITAAHQRGASVPELMDKYGLSRATIWRIIG
jgi:hypothetical protein